MRSTFDVDAIRAVKQVEQELGPIDIPVNSAGVYYPTLIGENDVNRAVAGALDIHEHAAGPG